MFKNDEKIDFSLLDPTRDTLRFEQLAQSIAARAAWRFRANTRMLVIRWRRPALAIAACFALVAWIPSLFGIRASYLQANSDDPAEILFELAEQGEPSATEVLDSLGVLP